MLNGKIRRSLGVFTLVSSAVFGADSPSTAVDEAGNTVIVWEGNTFNGSAVYARVVDASGNRGTIQTLSISDTGTARCRYRNSIK